MAFPPGLGDYKNEADFTQRLIIPLLQRMGFSLIAPVHGTWEMGKDIVFADIDRFAHVRYHAMQVKYEPSISVNDAEGLIDDAKQAFRTEFRHPNAGTMHRISTFYAANGGDISAQAQASFFTALAPSFGENVKLLDGKALMALDRSAGMPSAETMRTTIYGLLYEFVANDVFIQDHLAACDPEVDTEALRKAIFHTPIHIKLSATSSYIDRPTMDFVVPVRDMMEYHTYCVGLNKTIDECRRNVTPGLLWEMTATMKAIQKLSHNLKIRFSDKMKELGPLIKL